MGRLIAYWRAQRGLTQAEFATLMGRSVRWVEDVEGGLRQNDPRLSVLEQASDVLHVRLDRLLPGPRAGTPSTADPMAGVRTALRIPSLLTGVSGPGPAPGPGPRGEQVADLAALRREVAYGWTAYDAGDYRCLDRVVAPVVREAARPAARVLEDVHPRPADRRQSPSVEDGDADGQVQASAVLADALRLASAASDKFGDNGLAWRAADRSVVIAGRTGDPVLLAYAAGRMARAMVKYDGARAALDFARGLDAALAASLAGTGPKGLGALRALRLGAVHAAAHARDRATVRALLAAAEDAGGPEVSDAEHDVEQVAALIRLGDDAAALTVAARVDVAGRTALTREQHAAFLVGCARAHTRSGERGAAVTALLEAEAVAPQEVRVRVGSRRLVEDLLRAPGTAGDDGRLRALAERCFGTRG